MPFRFTLYERSLLCKFSIMPRKSRIDAPGVLYHVMGKGIERKKIIIASKDRHDSKTRLGRLGEEDTMAPRTVKCRPEPQTRNR